MEEKPKKNLIRETIKDRLRMGAVLKKAALIFCFALIFGVTAAFAFAFSQPLWSDLLQEEEPTTEIKIFEDETTAAVEPTIAATTEAPTEAEKQSEALSPSQEDQIEEIIKEKVTIDSFQNLYREIANKASKSLVKISTTAAEDFFNQSVPVKSERWGVIIAKVAGEVLVLTSTEQITSNSEIYVAVSQNYIPGVIKGLDKDLGIAIISIPLSELSDYEKEIDPIPFGGSSLMNQGSPVIALGAPTGINGSVSYGMITYIDSEMQVVDGNVRAFQTNISAVSSSKGILINTKGEFVAVISSAMGKKINSSFITAIALNDLKEVIEELSNSRAIPELGVQGQIITRAAYEQQGIPVGVYVTEVISGQAAENAGILPGDVITCIDEKDIGGLSQLTQTIRNYEVGAEIKIKIMRNNRGSWTEIELQTALGSR